MNASRIWSHVVGLVVLGLSLIVGLATTSSAQTKPATSELAPPPIPPAAEEFKAASTIPPSVSPASAPLVPSPENRKTAPPTSAREVLTPIASKPSTPMGLADPEQAAREFIVKGKKLAEDELGSLKKEAESLRTRLQKVEMAIARWEAVSQGLNQSDKAVFIKVDGKLKAQQPGWQPNGASPDDEQPTGPIPSSSKVIKKPQLETVRRPKGSTNTSDSGDLPPPVAPSDLRTRPLRPTSAAFELPPIAPSGSNSDELPPVAVPNF